MPAIEFTTEIDARPDVVWGHLTAFDRYEEWNPFTPSVSTDGRLGDSVTLRAVLSERLPPRRTDLVITRLDPPHALCWGAESRALRVERCQTLTDLGDGRTRYRSHETFEGLAGLVVVALTGRWLRRGYAAAAAGLKQVAES
ncbi:MAG: SRPBCC domain-containing protein [Acidimicrobiia bacterium]